MPYSQFTFSKVKEQFDLTIAEGIRFFPETISPVAPIQKLLAILEDLPWAIAVDTEKARSEVIINPILLELRRILDQKISVFSGEEFSVDHGSGLAGFCDFLVSKSPEQLAIEAPAIVTKGVALSELVQEQNLGWVVDLEIEAIANSIQEFLDAPDMARQKGDRARQFILENYTWDKIVLKMISIYKEIIDQQFKS
jgi:hypothetical protein